MDFRPIVALVLVVSCCVAVQLEELFHQIDGLIHFNHPPPLPHSPFNDKDNEDKNGQYCAIEYTDAAFAAYQLINVDNGVSPEERNVYYNHPGKCGLCSSLKDFKAFARVHYQLRSVNYYKCAVIGIFSRDWAVECFREQNFSAPCAELLFWKTMHCWTECTSGDCTCKRASSERLFTRAAGRHFDMKTSMQNFAGLPPINHEMVHAANSWVQPKYDDNFIQFLLSKRCLNPPKVPKVSPYEDPEFSHWIDPKAVCAAKFSANLVDYTLVTYSNEDAAEADGAYVTHSGNCGLCSSLEDLATYIGTPDMTTPVRRCGIMGFFSEHFALGCLYKIGFSKPCASIWYHNTVHTRKKCMSICLYHIRSPNNIKENGQLNPCILCDEEMSGPIFKAASARTRRNSGLVSAISRPGPSVYPLEHHYPKPASASAFASAGAKCAAEE